MQLVRATDSTQLWSESYDRKVDDIFQVQDEIAAAVVGELRVKLLGASPTAKPVDPKVYPLILQAEAFSNQGSAAGDTQAIELYQKIVAAAPGEARAWGGMSRAYLTRGVSTGIDPAEDFRRSREAATRAVELDPGNAVAHGAPGRIAADIDDFPTAVQHYGRVLASETGNLMILNTAGRRSSRRRTR